CGRRGRGKSTRPRTRRRRRDGPAHTSPGCQAPSLLLGHLAAPAPFLDCVGVRTVGLSGQSRPSRAAPSWSPRRILVVYVLAVVAVLALIGLATYLQARRAQTEVRRAVDELETVRRSLT